MKLLLHFALVAFGMATVFAFGAFAATVWNNLNPDYIIVKVFDDRPCSDPEYRVELASHTVSVHRGFVEEIRVMPPLETPERFTYRLRARYSDCPEVLSDERTVERGWMLYESITRKGTVIHQVRAR